MTLTDTARVTKKALLFGGIFFVVAFSAWGGWTYYQATRPKPVVEEQPTLNFGYLPKPPLPKSKRPSSQYSYNLDTESGGLPQGLPKLMKVYFIPQLGATFLAPDKAKQLALEFDFPIGPDILSPTQYRFNDGRGGQFIFDLNSGNLKFRRAVSTESAQLRNDSPKQTIEDQQSLEKEFKDFLATKGLLKDQLRNGRAQIIYDAPSQRDSQTASISLWQEDIENLSIVTAEYKNGLIKGVITKYNREQNQFISLDYIFWQVDKATFETYPIKTVDQAFEELKNGQGVVAIEPPKSLVSITKIGLAYLLAEEYTPYLQPVYLFEGENFAALVPAIPAEHLVE